MDLNQPYNNYTTVPLNREESQELTAKEEALLKEYEIREQDRWLPLANGEFTLSRFMKFETNKVI